MLGFIGTGNMATAIIKGIVSSKLLKGEQIAVFDILTQKSQELADEYGVKVLSSENEIAKTCDTVVLSVKPVIFEPLLAKIDEDLKQNNPLIISIAAGKDINFIQNQLSFEAKIVRVMPNINALVGAAISAYCVSSKVSEEEINFTHELCSSFGRAIAVDEKLFSIYGVIGGCSPAFAYMFIDSMARAAVKNGMPKDMALEICAASVLGSAKLILESGEHPWELVDKVCSPAGTTIEGVASLQKNAFESTVGEAVEAAYLKDKRM